MLIEVELPLPGVGFDEGAGESKISLALIL